MRSVVFFTWLTTTMALSVFPAAAKVADKAPRGMVLVPAGEFIMGSDKVDSGKLSQDFGNTKPWYLDEHPLHKVMLKNYLIDQYEVTNADYRTFVEKGGHRPPQSWLDNGFIVSLRMERVREQTVEKLRGLGSKLFHLDMDTRKMNKAQMLKAIGERLDYIAKLPVTYVDWRDANDYCHWQHKRLPSEAEWEKAARGSRGHEFPWGDEWKPAMSNAGSEEWLDGVAPVGSYPKDRSDFGVYDMAGNVSEWVDDWYQPYPKTDYKSEDFGQYFKVLRGAGWGREGHYAIQLFQRGAYRFYLPPDDVHADLGFRCARDGNPGGKAGGSVAGK